MRGNPNLKGKNNDKTERWVRLIDPLNYHHSNMAKYQNKEFSHLKWRLMNQEGLSNEEAEKRIAEIKEWDKKIKTDKKNGNNKRTTN